MQSVLEKEQGSFERAYHQSKVINCSLKQNWQADLKHTRNTALLRYGSDTM